MTIMNAILSPKKRERVGDELDDMECIHINKKIITEGLSSLRLDGSCAEGRRLQANNGMDSDVNDIMVLEEGSTTSPRRSVGPEYDEASENLLSILKSGSRKYGRRVDYLVDDLIRKTPRTGYSFGNCNSEIDMEDIIPNSIGPHPLTDRPLGMLWPTVVPTVEGAEMLASSENDGQCRNVARQNRLGAETSSRMDEDGANSDTTSQDSDERSNQNERIEMVCRELAMRKPPPGCHVAGLLTHSDWGIEELS
jgi:hypothetical protein